MRSNKPSLPSLAAAIAVLAFSAGAARLASAQESCSQYNQCYCTACCEELLTIDEPCGNGNTCNGTICVGGSYGQNTTYASSTVCFQCCGGYEPDYTNIIGTCVWTSPIAQGPAEGKSAEPALVYVRDCQGNYTLAQIGGLPYGT